MKDLFNINDFLLKFKKISPPDDTIRIYISETIFSILKIEIKKQNIKINNNSIYIQTNNIFKNEIFLNKNKILNIINKEFPKSNINNIF